MFATTKWIGAALAEPEPAAAPAARAVERRPAPGAAGASAALEGVSLEYDGATVLEDVSIDVAPGEALCLVGPSGGGKSTILNLLAGLVRPTRGRVLFDGVPVSGPGPERAVVFQDAALFPWLTLEKNIAFPLEVAGVAPAARAERVDELLRLVHLSRFRASFPHELSGGMRQRGAIARALATRPRMILFDEPFAALDGQMRELLQGEVERIVRASRTTMVFVTHAIDEAVRLGDRVVLIGTRPGRVIGEVHVDLPRPRRGALGGTRTALGGASVEDVQAVRIAQRIADEIRAEVDKVAREEADGAWGSSSGPDGGDPRRHLGRGI
ncbi:MAG: ABC transporter ATP-binding protein [Labilithrix sp.]|nr:ABC transporter ATP-binding protein [Labilithrix sp.]MBX3222588.1 ABC transporter ATP-binding protein [Labilithrix sp.]